MGVDLSDVHVKEADISGGIALTSLPAIQLGNLPDVHVYMEKIPKLTIGIDPVHLALDAIPKIQLGVDPLEIRLTQVPSTRTHLPADFHVGVSLLGLQLLGLRLCGEAQMITEPYKPNPCEVCAPPETPTHKKVG